MGFFSWLTSDTKEPIRNIHNRAHRTVYLLQPNGARPIPEDAYGGDGVFGGVDAYVWLAKMNLSQDRVPGFTDAELRSAGISLEHGTLMRMHDGKILSVFHNDPKLFEALGLQVENFPGRYNEPIPAYGGMSADQLLEAGAAKSVPISELVEHHPLKFSFDPEACYEDLPAAVTQSHAVPAPEGRKKVIVVLEYDDPDDNMPELSDVALWIDVALQAGSPEKKASSTVYDSIAAAAEDEPA